MICSICGRDLDAIGQDNMSMTPGEPLCEDCANDAYEEPEYPAKLSIFNDIF